jgi:hypothetical protein
MTAALVFTGTVYEPKSGDSVTIGDVTYTVITDDVRRNCWTWADKHRIRRRLFTEITSGE